MYTPYAFFLFCCNDERREGNEKWKRITFVSVARYYGSKNVVFVGVLSVTVLERVCFVFVDVSMFSVQHSSFDLSFHIPILFECDESVFGYASKNL